MKKIIILLMTLLPQLAFAQTTQFYLEDTLNDQWKVRIYVAAETQAKTQVQEALYHAVDHAREALTKLDMNNPSGELASINQKKTKGSFMVSNELAKAIEAGIEVGKWTDGALDIAADSKEASFRQVKVDSKNNELKIKNDNVTINLRSVMRGVLADLIADDLGNAGWKNCLVKIGSVFVTRGNDVNGPWKIPVVSPTDKLAKRALFYKATDVSAATLTTNDGNTQATSDLKLVTIFTESGARAEGLASAVYTMGLAQGRKFLLQHRKLRGVLGDQEGNFTHVPEWKPNP